jgi:hypothetical protein
MRLNIDIGKGSPEIIEAGTIFFDSVSPAVEIVLDALANMVIRDVIRAGELAQDFIDLFRPGKSLSDDELIGLFGELTLISLSTKPDEAVEHWHEASEGRYDFTAGNSRLEVKTSLGELRKHHFSSSQLPPKAGVKLVVASVLTESVQDGTTVVDLWKKILGDLVTAKAKDKLTSLVLRTVQKDYDKTLAIGFDYDAAIRSIAFCYGEAVPTPILTEGVLTASWEAMISEESVLETVSDDVNPAIRALCFTGPKP